MQRLRLASLLNECIVIMRTEYVDQCIYVNVFYQRRTQFYRRRRLGISEETTRLYEWRFFTAYRFPCVLHENVLWVMLFHVA